MAADVVPLRLSYLLCPDLTATTKLVWLGLRLDRHLKQSLLRSPSRIQRRIGVSRPTIRKALSRLKEPCRPLVAPDLQSLSQMQIRVNPDLITDKSVPAMARVLYCVLLGLQRLRRFDILSSYAGIAKVVRLQPRTVRLAVRALVKAGWLGVSQANQRAPIRFSFPNPKVARQRADVRRAKQRLEKSTYHGEALALLWCDILVDDTNYKDDYFPDSFTNPETNELLQADRYFFDHNVAVEFNGPQHDGPTPRYSAEKVEAQKDRDRIKQEICDLQGIALVTLRPEDLTFQRMREVLGSVLPLRDVGQDEPVIRYLERKSIRYLRSIARIRHQSQLKPRKRPSPHRETRADREAV